MPSPFLPVENVVVQFDTLVADAVQSTLVSAELAVELCIQSEGNKKYIH